MRKIVSGDGMSFIGVCLSVAGLAALGYKFLLWLNYGLWPPLAFRLVLKLIGAREPLFGWQRVEKISAWIFDLPLSGVLFGAALVAVIFGVAVTAGACPPGAAEGNPARFRVHGVANFGKNARRRSQKPATARFSRRG